MKQAIQSEFNLGLYRLPASKFSLYFTTQLNIVLQRSIDSVHQWLLGGLDFAMKLHTICRGRPYTLM